MITSEPVAAHEPGDGDRSPREVSDAQLWRDAIGAARRAAASAAEIRLALNATRPDARS